MVAENEIAVRILGSPQVSNLPGNIVFPAKGFQLIALLALAPSGRMTRKEAASLLWDSDSDSAALTNLRQLLIRMRRSLPDAEDLLSADAQTIAIGRLRPTIDLCRFEMETRSEHLPSAMTVFDFFRGDLLEGIDDATDAFAHWLTRERAALRERFFAFASMTLIELTRYGRASKRDLTLIAMRLLALEPEREASYRAIIEAYGRNGMHEDAAQTYQSLMQMLEREHGVRPAPETAAVVRRIFAGRPKPEPDRPSAAPSMDRHPRVAFLAPAWTFAKERGALLSIFIEDVANELSRYRSFAALAPHSSLRVGHDSGIPLDNATLRADYTISGFVKPDQGGEVLALRMVNCATGEIVWSGEFGVGQADLLKSFSVLSHRVASSLGSALERDRLAALRRSSSSNAYLHYLEGQGQLANCDLIGLRRARKSFRRALEIDQGAAPARARVAQTLYLEWIQLGGNDPQLLLEARQQAEVAIRLDPNDAIGHWVDGTIALYQQDFDHCEMKLAEADALCPNSADLLIQYADALAHLGDPDSGWAKFERALDLNPSPPDLYWWAGASIAFRRQAYDKAIDLCGRLASDESVLGILAASHAFRGDLKTARGYGARIKEAFPGKAAVDRSKVVPDRDPKYRQIRLEGLRLAGAI